MKPKKQAVPIIHKAQYKDRIKRANNNSKIINIVKIGNSNIINIIKIRDYIQY